MDRFDVSPIILVRNIFDVVVSLVDHHSRESNVYPAAFAPDDIASRSFDEQARFVTQMAIPWYFNFYASWQQCPDKFIVTYDDFIANPSGVMVILPFLEGFRSSVKRPWPTAASG